MCTVELRFQERGIISADAQIGMFLDVTGRISRSRDAGEVADREWRVVEERSAWAMLLS